MDLKLNMTQAKVILIFRTYWKCGPHVSLLDWTSLQEGWQAREKTTISLANLLDEH